MREPTSGRRYERYQQASTPAVIGSVMTSSDNEKPRKKPSGVRFSPIGSAFRPKFGKRRVSEGSQVGSRSASDSTTGSLVSLNEHSNPSSPYGENAASSAGEESNGAYSPQSAIRLVNTRWPSEADSSASSLVGPEPLDVDTAVGNVEPMVHSPEAMSPRPLTSSRRTPSDTSPPPSRTTTPIPSTPRIHWNLLRNAIVPAAVVSPASRILVPDAVPAVSGSTPALPRPQTPKPSRFARLGFRQVVEQTREVAQDEISRFEAEIYHACAIARFGDTRHKPDREGSQSTYLPFVSNTSLPLSSTTTTSQTNRFNQSSDSLARAAPSLRSLHQTLLRYASTSLPVGTTAYLPFEGEVLSVLLTPFMTETGVQTEERWLAVEAFEVAIKAWRSSSQQREVDRILWCCKAGWIPASPVRSRILGTLSNLLSSSRPIQDANPHSIQNIFQGLQTLLYSFGDHPQTSEVDTNIVRELCAHVSSEALGHLDVKEIEKEYDGEWSSLDTEESVRVQIVLEGVVRCMQSGSESLRRWILQESVETYWPLYSGVFTPLCKKIVGRRLSTFLRSSLRLLRSDMAEANRRSLHSDADIIIRLFQHRILTELEQLPLPRNTLDGRALAVELLLELLSIDSRDQRQYIIELICKWCDDTANGWQGCIETAVRLFVQKTDWSHLTKALHGVANELPDEGRKHIISIVLPSLHTRLVTDPPPYPLPPLTSLFQLLVVLYPQQFYKPLFSLAAASREATIVGHLHVVAALARHLPGFWIRDPEMISIALMSDVGNSMSKGKLKEGPLLTWSKTRMGQSLIMLELIQYIKGLTKEKKDPTLSVGVSQAQAYWFFTGLEARLAVLLDAKESSALIPFSQRVLLCILFMEIRLFSQSLKPVPWLQRIIIWATQAYSGANLQSVDNASTDRPEFPQLVGIDDHDEVLAAVTKIQSIYVSCWQTPPSNSRRSTMVLSVLFSPENTAELPADAEPVKEREELLNSLSSGIASATLRLLVAVSALLNQADHRTLGPVLWSHFLDDADPRIVAPACFLLTHCLEKSPKDITQLIEIDRDSSDNLTRRTLVRRLMTLYTWRSQLLSQTYIHDRVRRRPFKLARQPIAFVAIDVGSGSYVHEQTEEDRKNLPGGALPLELRKRLAEVGWEQDELPTDARLKKVRAPMSLFPVTQLDHINTVHEESVSPSQSADSVKLLHRKSSTSGQYRGGKRRPVYVPALVSLFSSLSLLVVDEDPLVASVAREAILIMLRDDPAMLCRPVMDMLSGDPAHTGNAISVLRAFLHVHNRLPPSASHHIFCHLGGFLKFVSRDFDTDPNALRAFSYTVPILSKLINQVSNLSIRDLRRSKFEIYVFPSGSLWFPPTAPLSTMFPQSPDHTIDPLDELPSQLVAVCMVRTAQNMLLFDMLKHKPQEVHAVRKALTGIFLPGESTGKELDTHSFLPKRSSNGKRRRNGYHQVSLALSRSYLLLLGQVFRTMSRNFSNKVELARLFDDLNKILLVHGDDIGIVAHALIACMIGATRFKRFISSNRGFGLFMPSILKVYVEAEHHPGIQHAIQYACSRFYAIHEEAYLFQSIDLASSMLVRLNHSEDQDWFARKIWRLFSALKAPFHRGIPDAAGIRFCNRMEEREALIAATVTDDTPKTGTQGSSGSEQLKKILASGQYDDKLLPLDDLARLFLTVIAYDPTTIRAQNFLALFRRMAPEFYNGSKSAREVLREGISALCSALFAKAPRHKFFESNQGRPIQHNVVDTIAQESEHSSRVFDDPSTPCDHVMMRREYLNLVLTFTQMGGDLGKGTIQRALDLAKGLLKESTRPNPESEGTFLHKLTESSFSRLDITVKHAVTLLQDVAPVIRSFALSIDCSSLLETILELLKRPELANDVGFVQFIVDQIAGPVVEACETAASEKLLMSLPMRVSVISLVRRTAALGNTDVVTIIEKQSPSPGFLAGIVLPLCLSIKTSGEVATEYQWQTNERPGSRNAVFLRLLAYVMEACRGVTKVENGRSSPLPVLHRRDSEKSRRSSLPSHRMPLATLAVVVQIIKVIVIRTGDDLCKGLSGLWARVARFLQQLLNDGDARFALPSLSSATYSPWQSPQPGLSPSASSSHERTRSVSSDDHFFSSSHHAPRVVDYLMWSLLEFICCAPSPLTLQMRLWMQEKVHNLDTELKTREISGPYLGRDSRRLSSSVFARSRGSSTSPEALRALHGLSKTPSELNLSASSSTDVSAYNRFPSSPGSLQPGWTGPRIVHLGPSKDHRMFQPVEKSSSLDSHLKDLARHTYIELPSLIQRTRDRIRLVQTRMGYSRLLPVQDPASEPSEIALKAWTRTSALTILAEEAKLIMEEFSESFYGTLESDFVVDVPSNPALSEPIESSLKTP